MILSGALEPGAFLTEKETAETLGLSRTPVREAFMLLATEDLLRLYPRRGALVVPVTSLDIDNVLDARRLIDPWAVERCCAHAPDPELARRLEAELADERAALPDVSNFFWEAGRRLYAAILASTGNPLVASFHDSLMVRQLRVGNVAVEPDPRRYSLPAIFAYHEQLVAAILRGDATGAQRLVHQHLDRLNVALRIRS